MTVLGADPDQLDRIARQLGLDADALRTGAANLDAAVRHTPWDGPDADEFRHRWSAVMNPAIFKALDALELQMHSLQTNARMQRWVSEDGAQFAPLLRASLGLAVNPGLLIDLVERGVLTTLQLDRFFGLVAETPLGEVLGLVDSLDELLGSLGGLPDGLTDSALFLGGGAAAMGGLAMLLPDGHGKTAVGGLHHAADIGSKGLSFGRAQRAANAAGAAKGAAHSSKFLGHAAGPLAIVGGVVDIGVGTHRLMHAEDGWEQGSAGTQIAGGVLAVAGGALLIAGAPIAGPALLVGSAAFAGVSWALENHEQIGEALEDLGEGIGDVVNTVEDAVGDAVDAAVDIAGAGLDAIGGAAADGFNLVKGLF